MDKEYTRNVCHRLKINCERQVDALRRSEGIDVMFGKEVIYLCNEMLKILNNSRILLAANFLDLLKEFKELIKDEDEDEDD